MSNMLVVYGIEMAINTANKETPTWSPIGDGFNNLSESLNEVVQQYFFLSGKGYAHNFVTGMSPVLTLSGVRVVGDAAQDFIFGTARKYGLMKERETQIQIKRMTAAGSIETLTCDVTIANVSDMSGATTDGSAVSCELRFNGKPVSA